MKKRFFATSLVILSLFSMSSKLPESGSPKFYQPIQDYYQSLSNNSVVDYRQTSIRDLKSAVMDASSADSKVNIVFTCPDNSFRSQAAQIILQSIASVKQIKKLTVLSAGSISDDIDPRLPALLSKIGYKVSTSTKEGKTSYEIKFSDQLPPITLYSKKTDDLQLANARFYLFNTCDKEESGCAEIKGAIYKATISYPNTKHIQDDKELEKEFNTIAADIYNSVKEIN